MKTNPDFCSYYESVEARSKYIPPKREVSVRTVNATLPDGRKETFTIVIKDSYVMFYVNGELVNYHCDYSGNLDEIDLQYCYINSLLWNIRQCGKFNSDEEAVNELMRIEAKYPAAW